MIVATAGACSNPWTLPIPSNWDSWIALDTMTNLMGCAATWATKETVRYLGSGYDVAELTDSRTKHKRDDTREFHMRVWLFFTEL